MTADHGRRVLRQAMSALTYLVALTVCIAAGIVGRWALNLVLDLDLLAWIWTGGWVVLVACGAWFWCDHANRRRARK